MSSVKRVLSYSPLFGTLFADPFWGPLFVGIDYESYIACPLSWMGVGVGQDPYTFKALPPHPIHF